MQQDVWKIIIFIGFFGLLGWTIDNPFELMLLAALGAIFWQFNRIERLRKWIENPKRFPIHEVNGQALQFGTGLQRISWKNQSMAANRSFNLK